MDYFYPMSLLCFWDWDIAGPGEVLTFHKKYLILCSEDEQVLQVWNDMKGG